MIDRAPWAREAGLNILRYVLLCQHRLDDSDFPKGRALAIRRFGRAEDGPVHIEDFAQVFGVWPDDKYKHARARYLAAKARLPEKLVIDAATETVARFRDEWPEAKKALPIAGPVADAIDAHLKDLALTASTCALLSTLPFVLKSQSPMATIPCTS